MKKNNSGYAFHKDTPLVAVTGYFESDKITEKGQPFLVFETRLLQGVSPFGPQAGVITDDDLNPGTVQFLLNKKDENDKPMYAHLLVKTGSDKASTKATPAPVSVEEEDETDAGPGDDEAVVSASEAGGAKAKAAPKNKAAAGKRKPAAKKTAKKADEEDFN